MENAMIRDGGPSRALAAYARATRIRGRTAHLVDAREESRFWRPSAEVPRSPAQDVGRGAGAPVTHRIHAPVKTSFSLGFGFAAGATALRALLLLPVAGALLIVLFRLLASL